MILEALIRPFKVPGTIWITCLPNNRQSHYELH